MIKRNNCETCGKLLEDGVTGNCFACIRGEKCLFNLQESKSPRPLWMERYNIKTIPDAWDSFYDRERWAAYVGTIADMPELYYGDSEDDAIVEVAKRMGIPLWNEPQK